MLLLLPLPLPAAATFGLSVASQYQKTNRPKKHLELSY
jgi:hypothetical protein